MIIVGSSGTAKTVVSNKNTAKAVGSGNLDVFSTPMMIALMEEAACNCISDAMEPGQSSVGTQISVAHLAASPIGAEITAKAVIDEINERKIMFTVTAYEGEKEIGNGTHTRFIIDVEKFISKLARHKA